MSLAPSAAGSRDEPTLPTAEKALWRPLGSVIVMVAIVSLTLPPSPGLWLTKFAAGLAVAMLVSLIKSRWDYAALASLYIFAYVSVLVGLLASESGAFMWELQRSGYPNGSGSVLLIFFVIFLYVSESCYRHTRNWLFHRSFPAISPRGERFAAAVIIVVVVMLSITLVIGYSSPLQLGVERQVYLKSLPHWGSLLRSAATQGSILALTIYFFSRERAWRFVGAVLIIASMAIITLVFGQKFSGLLTLGCWLLAFHAGRGGKLNRRLVLGALVLIVLSWTLIFIQYSYMGRDVRDFALKRVAMQGQVLWSLFADRELNLWGPSAETCLYNCGTFDGSSYGMNWLLSLRYLPPETAFSYWQGGSNLTGFEPATRIFMFGLPIALIIHALLACLAGVSGAVCMDMIARGNLLGAVIGIKVFEVLYWVGVAADPGPIRSGPTIVILLAGEAYLLVAAARGGGFRPRASPMVAGPR